MRWLIRCLRGAIVLLFLAGSHSLLHAGDCTGTSIVRIGDVDDFDNADGDGIQDLVSGDSVNYPGLGSGETSGPGESLTDVHIDANANFDYVLSFPACAYESAVLRIFTFDTDLADGWIDTPVLLDGADSGFRISAVTHTGSFNPGFVRLEEFVLDDTQRQLMEDGSLTVTLAAAGRNGGDGAVVDFVELESSGTPATTVTEAILTLDSVGDCGPDDAPTSGQSVTLEAGEYEFIAIDGAWNAWGCETCSPPSTGWFWAAWGLTNPTGPAILFGANKSIGDPIFPTAEEARDYYVVDPGTRAPLSLASPSVVWFWIVDPVCGDNRGNVTFWLTQDADPDQDGVLEILDNCPGVPNPLQEDADNDSRGDACDPCPDDPDSDADEVCAPGDNCPLVFNPSQADSDADGVGNACDNCRGTPNYVQADMDSDGHGDLCDNCPLDANATQGDFDLDGFGDACDTCVFDFDPAQEDIDSDGEGDLCDLNDGKLLFTDIGAGYVQWQPETVYDAFNLYRGDLSLLPQYTQDPALPMAEQFCGLTSSFLLDPFVPPVGETVHYLVTGIAGGLESSLGATGVQTLETLQVPGDGTSVASTTILDLGVEYIVMASGTFANGNGGWQCDAEYTFDPTETSIANNCGFSPAGVDIGLGIDDTTNDESKTPF